ncbi:hypothetical protein BDZ94DRAFT_1270677 [Collybia nuda]|uniref:RlpA-like protein double-psi beta-barrel domain-containing protein n=1 Tax=Collybia nuda TaxID=64659 RepID=A0A9P5XX65_9AGAR|nr:hypothetical protein BDZ94DRAFT_1270677 [Collybia nuda]
MVNTKSFFATLAALSLSIGSATAFTGRASWDVLGTKPCPIECDKNLDYRVALPITLFPNGERCCERVHVQYQDRGIDVTFTDLCLSCANSFNISLSHQAFSQIADLKLGQIYPVDWTFFPKA